MSADSISVDFSEITYLQTLTSHKLNIIMSLCIFCIIINYVCLVRVFLGFERIKCVLLRGARKKALGTCVQSCCKKSCASIMSVLKATLSFFKISFSLFYLFIETERILQTLDSIMYHALLQHKQRTLEMKMNIFLSIYYF